MRVAETPAGVLGQESVQDRLQKCQDLRELGDRLVHVLQRGGLCILPRIRRHPEEHLVEQGAQAVEIAACILRLALDPLRGHVARRADEGITGVQEEPPILKLRDAKIGQDQGSIVPEQHIRGLSRAGAHKRGPAPVAR